MKIPQIILYFFISSTVIFSLNACSGNSKNTEIRKETKKKDTIKFVKETDTVFNTPESVKYDTEKSVYYISNINGKPSEKDNNGFISKLNSEGNLIKLNWLTGLNAPKGMGIFGDKLYVTDIDELVEISIQEEKIIKKYPVKDAGFLNDIDIDNKGIVYVSDMATGKIWILKDSFFKVWEELGKNEKPNGLFCEKDRLLVGTKSKIISVN